MLGTCKFSACARVLSDTMPKVYLSWFLDASSVKDDLRVFSSLGIYAIITVSSADLNVVMFFWSRVETIGSIARLRKGIILA
jgi:hypothetical protein